MLAIMRGIDVVRVGIEDCLWTYPHRNEMIARDAEVVRKVIMIARELGREIATPDEAREIVGFKAYAAVGAS